VVNSPLFGLSRPVKTVEDAAFRLGFRELWSLAAATQISGLFQDMAETASPGRDSLWEHSLKVGILARRLSSRVNVEVPEELFMAGVTHDIGKLVLFCHDRGGFSAVSEKAGLLGSALIGEESRRWGAGHAQLGGALMKHWRTPDWLVDLVMHHHEPGWSGALEPPAAALTAADALAHAAKCDGASGADGLIRMDYSDGLLTEDVAEALRLDGPECIQITTEAMQTYGEVLWAFK
jgi:HD-like signal output (HDOD) protein